MGWATNASGACRPTRSPSRCSARSRRKTRCKPRSPAGVRRWRSRTASIGSGTASPVVPSPVAGEPKVRSGRATNQRRYGAPVPDRRRTHSTRSLGRTRVMAEFRGWPDAAFDFYERLELDNSKSFWQAHRAVYEESVRQPFDALSDVIEAEYGRLRVFRPYRDVRFSKDKAPYKTAAGAVSEGEDGSIYYVQVSAEGLFVGCGYYHMASDQ